ncbi:hypothetical protein [Hyphomicrobium sp. CS1BSMeth3]|uniref:hypothetical protein n=1 Tax=Hyphomicrobium sp. CS1BSMeth3 TaxID=1892844 RepID=UPI0011603841|nr:hypothetical protein [Hyphomicrobium sp. CS1BSMeth3]
MSNVCTTHSRTLATMAVGFMLMTGFPAMALEVSAGSSSVAANAAFDMKLDSANTLLKTAIEDVKAQANRLEQCNQAGRFYRPGTSGADANGCVPPTAGTMRLALASHHSTYSSAGSGGQTTYTAWVTANLCVLATVSPGTTEDNHSHGCWIEVSGNNYRTASRSHKGNTQCDMLCYNLVPN